MPSEFSTISRVRSALAVIPSGAMRDAMHGRYAGVLSADTLTAAGTYGLGPLEYLRGELLVLYCRVYLAKAMGDGAMRVVEQPLAKAPFFEIENPADRAVPTVKF